jgi:hypothetical protein
MEMVAYTVKNLSKTTVFLNSSSINFKKDRITLKPDETKMFASPMEFVAFKNQILKFKELGILSLSEIREKSAIMNKVMENQHELKEKYKDQGEVKIEPTREVIHTDLKLSDVTPDASLETVEAFEMSEPQNDEEVVSEQQLSKNDISRLKIEYETTKDKKRKKEIKEMIYKFKTATK